MSHPYVQEEFSSPEREVLLRYFTNVDRPVFALRNLPEVVKGALFARYSRTGKSLRRLFLDEFAKEIDSLSSGARDLQEGLGIERARDLYRRIFIEFGDDSVAQLGGAHIAVEQGSNILTKILEWGRLAAYLEQSTRYVAYDDRPGGRYRYYLEPDVMTSPHGESYAKTLDRIFDLYCAAFPNALSAYRRMFPAEEGESKNVYRNTIRAKALDALRGMLPAATVSNTGIFATGQAFENMLLRMRASPLAEAREVADMMLRELNEVIPVFLQRVEQPERGGVWSEYLRSTRDGTGSAASYLLDGTSPASAPLVTLTDFDPDAEDEMVAAMLFAVSDLPEKQLLERVRGMTPDEKLRVIRAYTGERANRRHKPGRALERPVYRFEILSDYGAFRDLQRHRMLTIEWQSLTPRFGYDEPEELEELGVGTEYRRAMELSEELWARVHPDLPLQAQYAVCMAFRIRYVMQLNAREAMHLIELRSSAQGHRAYRAIAHEMHRQIGEIAGHKAIAEMMKFVDRSSVDLERRDAERRAERKRTESRMSSS